MLQPTRIAVSRTPKGANLTAPPPTTIKPLRSIQAYSSTYAHRGFACENTCDFDRAIADYDRAIQIDPKDATIYNGSAYVRLAMGEIAWALTDAELALSLAPEDAAIMDNHGDMLCRNGELMTLCAHAAVHWRRKAAS